MSSEYEQPTRVVGRQGNIYWELSNGKLHRLDGPAVEYASGSKYWHVNGLLHRLDGPAAEYADGTKAWFLDDKELTEQQWTLEVCRRLATLTTNDSTPRK